MQQIMKQIVLASDFTNHFEKFLLTGRVFFFPHFFCTNQ